MSLSRRGLLAGAVAASLAGPRAFAAPTDPIVVNALGNLWDPNLSLGEKNPIRPGGEVLEVDDRAIADARAARLSAINITVGYVAGPGDPHQETLKSLDRWDGLVAGNARDLTVVNRAADIAGAKAAGKIGLIYGFQNSVQVGEQLQHLDEYVRRGVRVFQLTYNDRNMMGGGSVAPEDTPLTPLGRQLVERLNSARVMVDLSHSGRQTCLDAIAASKAPISINHTGCRALTDLPRNKTDEELRLAAEKGGFVGIYFMPFLTPDGRPHASAAADHIVHALGVCGEDHMGLGTDGSATGVDDLVRYQSALAKEIAERRAAGVSAKGEGPDTYPFVVDLRGPGQYATIVDLLSRRGVKAAVIDKVLGRNFIDYAARVWG
ncbi:dipeptidase [Phenylobacterium montanum]|uniref:Membrane dipeptidase n=1 Tax=Phenylobacterium montanum TaxID=2823693 RepID=A0A975G003_9CAUL|nr:membrane dipeptidase [Caulobacter sp. S6]QUD87957.1 membrane dipeptidase [Caulobacter sp. S6]